ncbi:MAG: hypothetical protein ABR502_11695 [Chitinophagaceae bacterium]
MLYLFPQNPAVATVSVFVLVIAINYGFELFSKITGKGHYDFLDAVAGTIGSAIGMAFTLCLVL